MRKQHGFNLVELAIVMVIIGLLLGGVLKGQSLVTSAKIKRVNNDFNGITAAVYTYLDRYGALPGDDTKAATRWAITTGATPDGNGIIGGTWNSDVAGTDESALAWIHLRKADLLSGNPEIVATKAELPLNAFDGVVGIEDTPITDLNGTAVCMADIPWDIAEIIDINFDDGIAETGLLRSVKKATDGTYGTTAAATYDKDEEYAICKRI